MTDAWKPASAAHIAKLNKATALARLLRRAGTSKADAAPRIQTAHELSDDELRAVLHAVWGIEAKR